jgi:hypothetical protein
MLPTTSPESREPVPYFPAMKRRLTILRVRQKVRALCDATGLGPSTGERMCCALIAAVVPFVLSFCLSIAFRQPAGYAAMQGVGSFLLFAAAGLFLVSGMSDKELSASISRLAAELPAAEAAWKEHKDREQAEQEQAKRERAERAEREQEARWAWTEQEQEQDEVVAVHRSEMKRCRYCAELIRAEARKCKHCGEILDSSFRDVSRPVQVIVHRSSKSPGTAAVLEVIFGLFFQTFGIGHIFAGNVGVGLFLMFGWWFFLACASCLGVLTLGIGFILIPACWFLLMIVSPISAANS